MKISQPKEPRGWRGNFHSTIQTLGYPRPHKETPRLKQNPTISNPNLVVSILALVGYSLPLDRIFSISLLISLLCLIRKAKSRKKGRNRSLFWTQSGQWFFLFGVLISHEFFIGITCFKIEIHPSLGFGLFAQDQLFLVSGISSDWKYKKPILPTLLFSSVYQSQ